MNKALPIVAIVAFLASVPVHAAESDLLRQSTQACIFGAAVLGVTSIIVLYPAMVVGTSGVPTTSLIIGNTLFGCGISALGAAAAGIYGKLYDRMFPTSDTAAAESAAPTEALPATIIPSPTPQDTGSAVPPAVVMPADTTPVAPTVPAVPAAPAAPAAPTVSTTPVVPSK